MTTDIVERLRSARWHGSPFAELSFDAAAEILRLRSALEWRPIESAPRDGTVIFVCSKGRTWEAGGETIVHHPRAYIAKWDPDGDSWTDEDGGFDGLICMLSVTGIWQCDGGWFQPNEVTHWLPSLPHPQRRNDKT